MSKLKIAVLASGGGSNLQAIIDATQGGFLDVEIACVIVDRKAAYARQRAEAAGIETFYVGKGNCTDTTVMGHQMIELLKSRGVGLVVLAGYLSILSEGFVSAFKDRIINIHPSLIPKYCGMHFHGERVHKAVLAAGDTHSGATVHFVDDGVDTGRIIAQMEVSVFEEDTVDTLKERVLKVEHQLLVTVIAGIAEGRIKIGEGA